jgi:hypothetical protein
MEQLVVITIAIVNTTLLRALRALRSFVSKSQALEADLAPRQDNAVAKACPTLEEGHLWSLRAGSDRVSSSAEDATGGKELHASRDGGRCSLL